MRKEIEAYIRRKQIFEFIQNNNFYISLLLEFIFSYENITSFKEKLTEETKKENVPGRKRNATGTNGGCDVQLHAFLNSSNID
jgi:hypothetical protein